VLAKGSVYWILGSFALAACIAFFTPYLYVGILIIISLLLFFRDPERFPASNNLTDVVSPADGRILKIQDNQLSIFMNLHNVHVNRSPIDGEIVDIRYHKGGKFPAFSKDSDRNERNIVTIRTRIGNVIVTQVSGAVVRRIVCYVKQKDEITRGQRIGMIRFGSRVDVLLPRNYSFVVLPGQKVKAGETTIAKLLK
jgi:phosphatidylserine decarboxylase